VAFGVFYRECCSYRSCWSAQEIEPVAPITRHNTGRLPEIETLVRPSDIPLSHQRAELLRATEPGQETPAEELLRSTER